MYLVSNPQFMNMATQLMSDPQMQNVMQNLVQNMFQPGSEAAASAAEPAAPGFDQILNS
jgi:hypothetical protein